MYSEKNAAREQNNRTTTRTKPPIANWSLGPPQPLQCMPRAADSRPSRPSAGSGVSGKQQVKANDSDLGPRGSGGRITIRIRFCASWGRLFA